MGNLRYRKMGSLVAVALLASTVLAGCMGGPGVGDDAVRAASTPQRAPYTVVAMVDSGINPYHVAFRLAPGEPAIYDLEPTLASVPRLRLTFGDDYHANVAQDREVWADVKPFTLYGVEGTRIMVMTWPTNGTPDGDVGPNKVLDDEPHGTGVASRVLAANPSAYVLMVEAGVDGVAPAISWIAQHPWVDIVSLSWGTIADIPYNIYKPRWAHPSSSAGREKLVLVGAGNEPTLSMTDDMGGGPWNVVVGGANTTMRGEQSRASKSPDFIAEYFTHDLPANNSVDGKWRDAGTSFSVPFVAGSMSKVILSLRQALGDAGPRPPGIAAQNATHRFTLWDVQEAFNRTAAYWGPQDWNVGSPPDPVSNPREFAIYAAFAGTPILPHAGPAGPWVQMGWGAVTNETADLVLRALLSGTLPEKPSEAVQYMQERQELREAYWRQFCPECFES